MSEGGGGGGDDDVTCVLGRSRVVRCSLCHYRTDRKNNLKRHTLTMHRVTTAAGNCCGLAFFSKGELRAHTQLCHRDGYHCGVCGHPFTRKALLRRHLSVHTGVREFSCPLCVYQSSNKSNVERHLRVHQRQWEGARVKASSHALSPIPPPSYHSSSTPPPSPPVLFSQISCKAAVKPLARPLSGLVKQSLISVSPPQANLCSPPRPPAALPVPFPRATPIPNTHHRPPLLLPQTSKSTISIPLDIIASDSPPTRPPTSYLSKETPASPPYSIPPSAYLTQTTKKTTPLRCSDEKQQEKHTHTSSLLLLSHTNHTSLANTSQHCQQYVNTKPIATPPYQSHALYHQDSYSLTSTPSTLGPRQSYSLSPLHPSRQHVISSLAPSHLHTLSSLAPSRPHTLTPMAHSHPHATSSLAPSRPHTLTPLQPPSSVPARSSRRGFSVQELLRNDSLCEASTPSPSHSHHPPLALVGSSPGTLQKPSVSTLIPAGLKCVVPEAKHTHLPHDYRRAGCRSVALIDGGNTTSPSSTTQPSLISPPDKSLLDSCWTTSALLRTASPPSAQGHNTTGKKCLLEACFPRVLKKCLNTWRAPSDNPPITSTLQTKGRATHQTEQQQQQFERQGDHTSGGQDPHELLIILPSPPPPPGPIEEEHQDYLPKKLRACKKFQQGKSDAPCIQLQHQQHLTRL
ncbi:hypothetical protein Pmani_003548 [Petrolisthes manimaculis]|uniref:C2H2-type domain-containing protein n=1 Tax=Petrolisthes manimaculis TaxID=1843537 RepID=A0AAE1QFQ1_9EUCA|nr:hypothetical protein Pmani_003548 [Petrolisthes manimaculis]